MRPPNPAGRSWVDRAHCGGRILQVEVVGRLRIDERPSQGGFAALARSTSTTTRLRFSAVRTCWRSSARFIMSRWYHEIRKRTFLFSRSLYQAEKLMPDLLSDSASGVPGTRSGRFGEHVEELGCSRGSIRGRQFQPDHASWCRRRMICKSVHPLHRPPVTAGLAGPNRCAADRRQPRFGQHPRRGAGDATLCRITRFERDVPAGIPQIVPGGLDGNAVIVQAEDHGLSRLGRGKSEDAYAAVEIDDPARRSMRQSTRALAGLGDPPHPD